MKHPVIAKNQSIAKMIEKYEMNHPATVLIIMEYITKQLIVMLLEIFRKKKFAIKIKLCYMHSTIVVKKATLN